jgi:hypothetical protein
VESFTAPSLTDLLCTPIVRPLPSGPLRNNP